MNGLPPGKPFVARYLAPRPLWAFRSRSRAAISLIAAHKTRTYSTEHAADHAKGDAENAPSPAEGCVFGVAA
ncbi:MAG: hypothetical protein JW940_08595, partial [Polyangiaceae bacterium]|nr:hypothetical protein [Polyangiaceae bacterium]